MERTLRRDAATDGAEGPFWGMGTLLWRKGVVVDLLRAEDKLDVDRFGSRKDVGGAGMDILRVAFAAVMLSRLARLGGCKGGIGVALGERGAESADLGTMFVVRRSGTTVVTPLMLLARETVEKDRGLTMPVDEEPAVVERDVVRE